MQSFVICITIFAVLLALTGMATHIHLFWSNHCETNTNSNKLVLAHYMIQYINNGTDLPSYRSEMQVAKDHGIDAFALNCGYDYEKYHDRIHTFFQAAKEVEFQVVLSIDTDSFRAMYSDPIPPMIAFYNRYKDYEAYLSYQGKPLVTTFGGDAIDWSQFSHLDVNLVVNFFGPVPAKNQLAVDGFFAWPPQQLPSDQETYLASLGKTFMTYVTPAFDVQLPQKNYSVDFHIVHRWTSAISFDPSIIELVTWNDFTESTNFIDPTSNTVTIPEHRINHNINHFGFLSLSKHFIQQFKGINCKPDPVVYLWYNMKSIHVYGYFGNTIVEIENGNSSYRFPIGPFDWYLFDLPTTSPSIKLRINGQEYQEQILHDTADYSINVFYL